MPKPSGFIGFPDKKMNPMIVPDHFFSDLMPQIDDLAELKLTLHCFWLLNEQEGDLRYLRGDDLRSDANLLAALTLDSDLRQPMIVLEDALERSVARNTLLRLDINTDIESIPLTDGSVAGGAAAIGDGKKPTAVETMTEDWYFMNTVKGRKTLALIRQGRLQEVLAVIPDEARLYVDRPNIFVMYEQNVGMMTPIIADQLRDLEKGYSPSWIEEAFEIAISRNARNLRYIQAVLKRWETDGKDLSADSSSKASNYEESGRSSKRKQKYIPDEFSDIIIG